MGRGASSSLLPYQPRPALRLGLFHDRVAALRSPGHLVDVRLLGLRRGVEDVDLESRLVRLELELVVRVLVREISDDRLCLLLRNGANRE